MSVVRLLLAAGARIDDTNNTGKTPLMLAALKVRNQARSAAILTLSRLHRARRLL